jgi:phosphatidylglycerol:prolipoprotein diacylglycerol transferase
MVFYGGMIFGILAVLIYAGISRLELGNLFDTFASGLALGLAIGRVGCFMAGCCWGDVCVNPGELSNATGTALDWQIRTVPAISSAGFPLAVRFPAGAGAFEQHVRLGLIDEQAERSFPVHPVQLYESALALTLCGFLVRCFRRRRWRGQIVCLFLLGYSGIRFGTEFLRADNRPIYLGLTLSQMISVVSAGFALLVWLSREKSAAILRAKQPEPIPPAISAPASSRSAGS